MRMWGSLCIRMGFILGEKVLWVLAGMGLERCKVWWVWSWIASYAVDEHSPQFFTVLERDDLHICILPNFK